MRKVAIAVALGWVHVCLAADAPRGIQGGGHVPHFGSDSNEACTHRTRNRIKALMAVELPVTHAIHPAAKNRLCK